MEKSSTIPNGTRVSWGTRVRSDTFFKHGVVVAWLGAKQSMAQALADIDQTDTFSQWNCYKDRSSVDRYLVCVEDNGSRPKLYAPQARQLERAYYGFKVER